MYKVDKTSLKKAILKLSNINSNNIYLELGDNKLRICDYDMNMGIIANVKVIESKNENNFVKLDKENFLKMFENIQIIKRGIKDKAYFIEVKENKCYLAVCQKDELTDEAVKEHLNIPKETSWTRNDLVDNTNKYLKNRTEVMKKKLYETIGAENNDVFNVRIKQLEDRKTRSAKVQLENYISLNISCEKAQNIKQFDLKNMSTFVTDIIQFKQIINFTKDITLKEEYVNGMNNICVALNKDVCSFTTTDMVRVCKTSFKLDEPIDTIKRIIIPKEYLLNFINANTEDVSICVRGFASDEKIALQTESATILYFKNDELVDMKLDIVSKAFRFQDIKVPSDMIEKLKKSLVDIRKFLKSERNIPEDGHAKAKDFTSYDLIFEIEDKEVVNMLIQRTYESFKESENTYIYNLQAFQKIINNLFTVNYRQENFSIYFDQVTKMAFFKADSFESENYSLIGIFPKHKEK